MNIRRILIVLYVLVVAVNVLAQQQTTIGYCGGEITENSNVTVDGKKWVSGCIYLPPTLLKNYDGCTVKTIRAGLASKINIDSVKVWIRTSLTGTNIVEECITNKTEPKLQKGWNDVPLSGTYTISSEQGIYLGYSYHQKTAAGIFSVIGSSFENGFYAQLGDDEQWTDMSSIGILSVEAIVEGDNMPDYDLGLSSATINSWKDPSTCHIVATIVNNGQKEITGFTLSTKYENSEEVITNHFDCDLSWNEKFVAEYQIPSHPASSYGNVVVSIISLDEGEDENFANNTILAKAAMRKKILIEEYTSQYCSNCPRVATWLHTVLSEDAYRDCAVAVCHHSGYKSDVFTNSADERLASFFGVGFNPAVTYDRTSVNGNDIVTLPDGESDIRQSLDKLLEQSAHVNLLIAANYDEDSKQLHINISGERDQLSTPTTHQLTVYLLENNVYASRQSGWTGGYENQHVIRAYNSFFGDKINWVGNEYENEFTFEVDDQWNKENMEVVAFISNYDESSKSNNAVDNVDSVVFPVSTDIKDHMQQEECVETYYTLDGVRIPEPNGQKGIFIVRKGNVTAKKINK